MSTANPERSDSPPRGDHSHHGVVGDRDRATGAASGLARTRDRRRAIRGQAAQLVIRLDAAGHAGREKLGAVLADEYDLPELTDGPGRERFQTGPNGPRGLVCDPPKRNEYRHFGLVFIAGGRPGLTRSKGLLSRRDQAVSSQQRT